MRTTIGLTVALSLIAGCVWHRPCRRCPSRPPPPPHAHTMASGSPVLRPPPPTPPPTPPEQMPAPVPPTLERGREDEERPQLRVFPLEAVPIPEGKRKYRYSQAEIKEYPWPTHVTAEERQAIEEAIETFKWGGRDMLHAEDYLAGLDTYPVAGERFRAVGRLVSEFKRTYDEFGGGTPSLECLSRLMVVDRVLRRIDGFMERDFADRKSLTIQSTEAQALRTMKRWNWWYDLEKWRMRREPWVPLEDLLDPEGPEEDDG